MVRENLKSADGSPNISNVIKAEMLFREQIEIGSSISSMLLFFLRVCAGETVSSDCSLVIAFNSYWLRLSPGAPRPIRLFSPCSHELNEKIESEWNRKDDSDCETSSTRVDDASLCFGSISKSEPSFAPVATDVVTSNWSFSTS